MNSIPYFAYGSNMDTQQMAVRCPGARLIGTARLHEYLFLINAYGVATVVPVPGAIVQGILWELTPDNVDSLDIYEGVEGGLYFKEYVNVESENCSIINALIYIASNSTPAKPAPPSFYLQRIQTAAQKHGFTVDYPPQGSGYEVNVLSKDEVESLLRKVSEHEP